MKQCNFLLLVTGDGVGCATGKLFEYMATESDIVCFSVVRNEAANILEETGCGRTILVGDDDKASAFYQEMTSGYHRKSPSQNEISKYSRINQAGVLSRWIQESCL